MEWVYVYKNVNSEEIGYVGRSKNELRCSKRITEHRCEPWHKAGPWKLYFIPCLNRAESEAIETELINRYNPCGNRDKKGWGLFLEDLQSLDKLGMHISEDAIYGPPETLASLLERISMQITTELERIKK